MSKKSYRPNRRNRHSRAQNSIQYLMPYTHEWWERYTEVNIMQTTISNIHAHLSGIDINKMICQICGDNDAKDYIATNSDNPELLARFCDDCRSIQKSMYGLETVLYNTEERTISFGEMDIQTIDNALFYRMHDGTIEKITVRNKCPVCHGTNRIETEHYWATFLNAHIRNGCINAR